MDGTLDPISFYVIKTTGEMFWHENQMVLKISHPDLYSEGSNLFSSLESE